MNQKNSSLDEQIAADEAAEKAPQDLSDADPDFNVDPKSEEMKKIDDSVERAAW